MSLFGDGFNFSQTWAPWKKSSCLPEVSSYQIYNMELYKQNTVVSLQMSRREMVWGNQKGKKKSGIVIRQEFKIRGRGTLK